MMLILAGLLCISVKSQSHADYRVKAAFLYNFTQFIQWPANAFESPYEPLVIGILGKNPFGDDLKEVVSGEKGNGHFIVVRRYNDISEIRKCHILFINKNDTTDLNLIDSVFSQKPVLLVSDGSADFLDKGGMIRFVKRKNKIQLQINLASIKSANLAISSKMLRLAELINEK
ncbi:MAG TPA: YfiR family protein [Lentimicrobium sp.]|nr:YfiR family protein [Lentimicrobium sp.]